MKELGVRESAHVLVIQGLAGTRAGAPFRLAAAVRRFRGSATCVSVADIAAAQGAIEAAYGAIDKDFPDIVVSAWSCADGDGLDVIEAMRPWQLPVVLVADRLEDVEVARAFRAGARDVLLTDREQLASIGEVVERVVEQPFPARTLHEINNLVMAIRGGTELARHCPDDPRMAGRALEEVESAATALQELAASLWTRTSRPSDPLPRAASITGPLLVARKGRQGRAILSSALEQAGYRTLQAADAAAAAQQLGAHRDEIALVVLDLDLPDGGGPTCLESLRRLRPDLPAVMTCPGESTSHAVVGSKDLLVLHEPIRVDALVAAIVRRLALRSQEDVA
jgi:DNA-binding response OmpR family regulator